MNVLITGANGGLGAVVCREYAASGATVIAAARSWKETAPYATISADLATREGCEAMVQQALRSGPIDALVHLVGGFAGGTPISQTTDEVWDGMMNINVRAAFCAIRAVLGPMAAAGRGRIVAVGSRAAVEPSPNLAAYAVSKAALVALVKNAAVEASAFGVTANVVLPSTIDTPPNRAAMPTADFTRWVTPESIARLLMYLTSDAAANTSGAVIPIYGGA